MDPDIILINDHSLLDSDSTLKVQHYTVYTINKRNEIHSGTAITLKSNIKHTIQDDILSDLISDKVETSLGPVFIATLFAWLFGCSSNWLRLILWFFGFAFGGFAGGFRGI